MPKLLSVLPFALLLAFASTQARADTCNGFSNNLVSNCGFESGSFSNWTGTATTASTNYAGVDSGDPFTISPTPYNGKYEAYLGSPSSTIALTQALSTVSGGLYLVQFALLNDTSPSTGYTNSFALLFGGANLFSESAVNAGGYTLYSFLGTAPSSTTNISFVSRNDAGYFALDSVSVTATTPEPSSLMLLGTGVLGLGGVLRRRRC